MTAVLGLAAVASRRTEAAPITLFNTGVLNDDTLAPGGEVDLHYTLDGGAAIVSSIIPASYLGNGPDSQWIGPAENLDQGFSGGTFTYQTTFSLAGLDPSVPGRNSCNEIRSNARRTIAASGDWSRSI